MVTEITTLTSTTPPLYDNEHIETLMQDAAAPYRSYLTTRLTAQHRWAARDVRDAYEFERAQWLAAARGEPPASHLPDCLGGIPLRATAEDTPLYDDAAIDELIFDASPQLGSALSAQLTTAHRAALRTLRDDYELAQRELQARLAAPPTATAAPAPAAPVSVDEDALVWTLEIQRIYGRYLLVVRDRATYELAADEGVWQLHGDDPYTPLKRWHGNSKFERILFEAMALVLAETGKSYGAA